MKVCSLCLEAKELRRSHVIPDAVFRRLLRKGQGKAIELLDDDCTPSKYSSNSHWEYLFCSSCEKLFNESYESYALKVLRGQIGKVQKHRNCLTISNIEVKRFQSFLLSIYWRAAVSCLPFYDGCVMYPPHRELMRKRLLNNTSEYASRVSIRLERLIDPSGKISMHQMKDLISQPFARDMTNRFSFHFMFEGFLISIYTPGLSPNKRNNMTGILKEERSAITVPYKSFLEVPELISTVGKGMLKHRQGLTVRE